MINRVPIVLAIDFDETIAINDPFPNIIGLVPEANLYIRKLYEEGYHIVINTCRSGENAKQAMEYLDAQKIPFHNFNENHPALVGFYSIDCRKISADIYIDDKNLHSLPSWEEIYQIVISKEIKNPTLSFTHKTEKVCQ